MRSTLRTSVVPLGSPILRKSPVPDEGVAYELTTPVPKETVTEVPSDATARLVL